MDTVIIPLTQGQVTVIDVADLDLVSRHHWWAARTTSGFYAAMKMKRADGVWQVMQMQRFLMGAPAGLNVDHINRNTLDNKRTNLRVATDSQNKANTPRYRNNQSGFKGVYWRESHGQWHAGIRHHRKMYFLGYFRTPEEAARAYDTKAKELHGAFARCNFPNP